MKNVANAKKNFKPGAKIQWNWMGRTVKGSVKEVYFKPVKRTFRGNLFKRNGSKELPAYLVITNQGNEVLKLHSELSPSR